MFSFLKNALAELSHVVWPSHKETVRYMTYTVGTIIIVGIFLAILGYIISTGMSLTRGQFTHVTPTVPTVSGEEFATQADLKQLEALANARKAAIHSGSTASGTSASGITLSGGTR